MSIPNLMMIFVVFVVVIFLIVRSIRNNKNEVVDAQVEVDDKTYTLDKMIKFVKRRLDEITKINLYDIGLSEEELKRRKAKKLSKEYGVDETNISKAIPFDTPSLLSAQDKFDILIHEYKKTFSYEALSELIKKYKLDSLKYVAGETKPCYVITSEEIDQIFEEENLNLAFADKLEVVVQRIYQQYKGYSSIDEIRDMNIDGVSGRSFWSSREFLKPSCSNRWRLFKTSYGS